MRAVIFDMDGVLVDSEPVHHTALNRVLARRGHALDFAAFCRHVGTTAQDTWSHLIEQFGLEGVPGDFIPDYDAELLALLAAPLAPAPGLAELLDWLDQEEVAVAVASSSRRPWVEATLRSLDLAVRLPIWICGDDVTRGKPDPAIYVAAAAKLEVPAGRCVAVEDAPQGVLAARAAGMRVVAVRTPYVAPAALAPADLLIETLADFPVHWLVRRDR